MSRKKMPSLEELSAVIAQIHEAGVEDRLWPETLVHIGGLFGSPGSTIWLQDAVGRLRDVRCNQQIDAMTDDYTARYGILDALRIAVQRAPVGTVLTHAMVVPRREFIRTEFYADFARPYDATEAIESHVFSESGHSGYVCVTRSARIGAFEREDIRLLRLLVPHLCCAMRTRHLLASIGVERDSALDALERLSQGVLIVDDRARVVHANEAAEVLLRRADWIDVDPASRRLRATASGQTGALRALIARAATIAGANGALRLERGVGEPPLLICAAPLRVEAAWNVTPRPAALLVVESTGGSGQLPLGLLRTLYDLTPTETAVANHIAQGQGVKSSAETLRIAPSTVRWHLQRIFEKTGTGRQAELARLIERLRAGWPS
jgi:DNA-binding CsgD family transcriptional regulator